MINEKIKVEKTDHIEEEAIRNQAICKLFSLLIDYPTYEKFERAKKIAEVLLLADIPDYLIDLCKDVCNMEFSEELQADWIDIFESSIPPYLIAWTQEKNPALLVVLDRIYASENAYVPENEMSDNLSCVFEFLSLLFSQRKYKKIKAMTKFLKYIEKMKEPPHNFYGKVVKSMKKFVQEIIEKVD